MASAFEQAGAQSIQGGKSPKSAPIWTAGLWNGLFTNRNQLLDNTPSQYSQFYGIMLKDSVIDGLNMEASPKKTLWRRVGNSVANSSTFSATNSTVGFSPVSPAGELFLTVSDTATAVYNSTGNGKVLLFTKLAGAGPTRFQQQGNRLFAGDGMSNWVWNWFPARTNTTVYSQGSVILDSGNNIQQALGFGVSVVSTSVTTNVLTVTYSGTGTVNTGDTGTLYGLTTQTFLNGNLLTVTGTGAGTFTAAFTTGNYGTTADTGVFAEPGNSGTSGNSTPSFSGTIGSVLIDGSLAWQSKGFSVQNMGIVAPIAAPTTQNISISTLPAWVASTYYWPTPLIVDANTNAAGPYIWLLTTAGTTNGSVPATFTGSTAQAAGNTVTDGTAVWTCQGTAVRAATTAYAVGSFIRVVWTYTYSYTINYPPPRDPLIVYVTITGRAFFRCTVAGTTSSSPSSAIWGSSSFGLGATVRDSSVTWVSVGYEVDRTSSATSSPTFVNTVGVTAGNVGNSVLVSLDTQISPSGTSTSPTDLQTPVWAGKSNSSIPAFPADATPPASNIGKTTTETSGLIWHDLGTSGQQQSGSWVYAFTYANSSTGDESTGSPLSLGIVEAANSAIQVSGAGSPDTQVDTIRIYRSTEGLVTPFFLTAIPAPANGASWSFVDSTLDPGNPGSTLDVAIICPGYLVSNGIVTNPNDPPPTGLTNLQFHAGYMFGSVGNVIYWSTGPNVTSGNGPTSWNALNFSETPGNVTRFWSTTQGLFVFTISGTSLIYGTGSSTSPFTLPQALDSGVALEHYDAFDFDGPRGFAYSSDSVLYEIQTDVGNEDIGWKVADVLKSTFDPATSGLCFYRNGSDDAALYIHDFSSQWYRISDAPAPEQGVCISPLAQIQGGMSSVNRIQTAPGLFSMLIGPKTSGPILARDTTGTVFTDNGTAYDAFAVIGSIPLAKPGQMAAIEFVGVDAIKAGKAPTVGLLLDNFSRLNGTNGMPTTPAFTVLNTGVTDPKLPVSVTNYILRYYAIQSGQSVLCQSAQFKFSFGQDAVRSEIFSYTIYGSQWNE